MDATFTVAELWRVLAVLDVALLFGCAVYLFGGYGADLPAPLRRVTYGYGAVFILIVVAVIANYLSADPPTVGVKVFALGAAIAALHVLVVTVQVARHGRR